MKQFLIRLFNLEKPECPSCKIYEKWMNQLRTEADNNQAILAEENQLLKKSLETAYARLQEDKEAERQERQALEDTVLRHLRLRGQQPTPVKVPVSPDAAQIPLRPGTAWNRMKYSLEEESRRKADQFRKREDAEVKAGRLAPDGNIRETQTDTEKVDQSRR